MTREEAIQRVWTHSPSLGANQAPGIVEALVALGMLNLDEPKSLEDKLRGILGFLGPNAGPEELKYAIDSSGLKIVEKDDAPISGVRRV